MAFFIRSNCKIIYGMELFFLYVWLVVLKNTDSYYSIYLILAVLSLITMKENKWYGISKDQNPIPVLMYSIAMSLLIVMANYKLFEPWTALQSLFNAVCTFVGGVVIFRNLLNFILDHVPLSASGVNRTHANSVFLCSFFFVAGIYLCYLMFHSYPGLLSTDSFATIIQIQNQTYNNTMPYWHTRTVEVFYQLGMFIFGDINNAVALFLTVQILYMAACFAYAVVTLYQTGVPYSVLGIVLISYGILPYHVAYSVTLWKDVLFAGAALLTVTALYRILREIGRRKRLNELVFIIGAAGLSLWRTNGWYAFAAAFLIMIPVMRKKYKRLLWIMGGVVLACWILINPLLTLMNIPETNFVEALGIPFQQIARVVAEETVLTEEETDVLGSIFNLDMVKELYDPQTVDPIKFEAMHGREYLKNHLKEFALLWIRLGIKYPGIYLQAWIETTKGYWNGGYDYWIYMYHMDENTHGFYQTAGNNGISSAFLTLFRYLEKPEFLQPLYSIGLHVWMLTGCCFINVCKRRKQAYITIPILVIVAGLLIGTPVFAEFRYAYPVFTTMPLIGCVTIFEKSE